MKELVKVGKDFYLVDETEPSEYTYHKRKHEILKVNGVGEVSGEVFHEKGFSFKEECLNVLRTTNEKINIPKMNKQQLLKLIVDKKAKVWSVYLDENGEIVKLINK